MARDFTCETLDPRHPKGPRVEVTFPGEYTIHLYKNSPVDFENLRAAKHVLEDP